MTPDQCMQIHMSRCKACDQRSPELQRVADQQANPSLPGKLIPHLPWCLTNVSKLMPVNMPTYEAIVCAIGMIACENLGRHGVQIESSCYRAILWHMSWSLAVVSLM